MPYEFDGVQYPSVTGITGMLDKPALLGWAARCAVEHIQDNIDAVRDPIDVHRGEAILEEAKKAHTIKRDSAADSGTKAHKAAELYIEAGEETAEIKELLEGDEDAQNGFNAFLEWVDANHVEFLESEVQVFSVLHGYAGRFDLVAKVNGHRTLIDLKTSSGIYDEMKYQLCAYLQAYNEMLEEGQEPIEKIAILHLDKKTGEPTYKPIIKDVERMTELFNCLVRAYYLMKNRRLKNNPFVDRAKKIGEPIVLKGESGGLF
jgi:hypothetical protein